MLPMKQWILQRKLIHEDHGKLSTVTLFVSLFVLLVHTFNVFVSALVGVCAHSASCAHSITLFVRLSLCLHRLALFFFYSVYVLVCVCVQSLCLCKLYVCPAVSFCPLCSFLPLCVFLPSCLSAHGPLCPDVCVRSVCVHSAFVVCAHPRCLCLLSSVSTPTLLLPALCTLRVFVHFISHQDLGVISGTWVIL